MSRSNDAEKYFQTTDSIATSERKAAKAKNKHGNPVKLPSKLLAVLHHPSDDDTMYVAEAAGDVKRVRLDTGDLQPLRFRAGAPLTCLALSQYNKLFAGCWDKKIYSTSVAENGASSEIGSLSGHTDFVKCLLTASLHPNHQILLSGSADATIIVWDLDTGKPLHKLKGHVKALQDLAIDPLSLNTSTVPSHAPESLVLFSASSDREIRRWHIGVDQAYELSEPPILAHETSVYKLCFDSEGDLWTASADKTAKHLVRSRGWQADTVLQHPDFVRDVVVNEAAGLVVTACRDEEVRVWEAGSGDLVALFAGHFEEVTGLALYDGGRKVVSVSIDGTLRRWSLDRREMERYLKDSEGREKGEEAGVADGRKEQILTAEEEAELAELLEEDDE